MAKPKDEKDRRTKRIMVSLTGTEYFQLTTLAKVAGKLPAVIAREILTDYLSAHKEEIEAADRAADAYQKSLKPLRLRQTSLFPEEEL